MNCVSLADLVWPYRPDVLIRIDFLEWWRDARPTLWPDAPTKLDALAVRGIGPFFAEVCRQPYFLQYSRKMRYRNAPLGLAEASGPYAGGVAAFLTLASSIERNGYELSTPIKLRVSPIQRYSGFGAQQRRRWFVGDG